MTALILTHDQYLEFLARAEVLIELDPEVDTPEAEELLELVEILERYEKLMGYAQIEE